MPIPDHVAALRARIGHAPLLLPGVSAVVLDDDGAILLARRRDNGLWAIVSGILEPGEQPARAAVREVLEETGIHARVVRVTSVESTDPVEYPNGDVASYVDVCFLLHHESGEAHVADDENTEVGWFAPDGLPHDVTASTRRRVAHALRGRDDAWFASP